MNKFYALLSLFLLANTWPAAYSASFTETFAALSGVNKPLLAYYPFSSMSGFSDLAGNGPDVGTTGPVSPATGPNSTPNFAVSTDGSSSYMTLNSPIFAFSDTQSFTWTLWLQTTQSTQGSIFMYYNTAGTSGVKFFLMVQASGDLGVLYSDNVNPATGTWETITPCSLSTGAVVSIVYNASATTVTAYCDSTVGPNVDVSSYIYHLSSNQVYFGYDPWEGHYLEANYACLGVYQDALTPEEASSLISVCLKTACGFGANCANNSCSLIEGQDSNYTCSSCTGNFAPDQCTSCLPGFVGTNCDIACSLFCGNDSCAFNASSASSYSCSSCINANFADDQCSAGNCKSGFSGDDCLTAVTTTPKASTTNCLRGNNAAGSLELDVSIGNSNENENSNAIDVNNNAQI